MVTITIRPESADDLHGIDIVNISAFEEEDEARLVTALRHSQAYIPELSLVAEGNRRILGHLMMFTVQLEQQNNSTDILALAPMSVLPSHSHRGIGSELIITALDQAKKQGFPAVIVVGYPDYYSRFGFKPAHLQKLDCNLQEAKEDILALVLKEGIFSKGGTIIYPPVFHKFYELSRQTPPGN